MATKLAKRRVHIPARHWTAFSLRVFDTVMPGLRRRHSALVYLVLYHYAWHDKRKRVHASFATLSKWCGLDYRTVEKCVRELEFQRVLTPISKGTLRSRLDLRGWKVPAAEFDMGKAGWVPVPSFIITRYLPVCPACALLPLFLYYQNIQKLNYSWVSALTLSIKAGWFSRSRHRIYEALAIISDKKKWKKLGTGLPRPLTIFRAKEANSDTLIRHYQAGNLLS